jgi:NADH-quinone oxidoreductase subunit M
MIASLARLLLAVPVVTLIALPFLRRRREILLPLVLVSTLLSFLVASAMLALFNPATSSTQVIDAAWIPTFGARCHLAPDGIGLFLGWVASFTVFAAVLVSLRDAECDKTLPAGRLGLLLLVQFASCVLFMARDLLLFIFAAEILMLAIVRLLHGERALDDERGPARLLVPQLVASTLFFTVAAALMVHGWMQLGVSTFSLEKLRGAGFDARVQTWLFAGLAPGFLIRAGAWPFHQGLFSGGKRPSAHSLLLGGLLAASGAYGLVAVAIPILPLAAAAAAPWLMVLGVAGALLLSFAAAVTAETRRSVAIWFAAWVTFAVFAIVSLEPVAMAGAILLFAAAPFAFAALMRLVEIVEERGRGPELAAGGGLIELSPWCGALLIVALFAACGAPLTAGFPALVAILAGLSFVSMPVAIFALLVPVIGVVVALRLFFGLASGAPPKSAVHGADGTACPPGAAPSPDLRRTWRPPTAAELFMPTLALLLLLLLGAAPWQSALGAIVSAIGGYAP